MEIQPYINKKEKKKKVSTAAAVVLLASGWARVPPHFSSNFHNFFLILSQTLSSFSPSGWVTRLPAKALAIPLDSTYTSCETAHYFDHHGTLAL